MKKKYLFMSILLTFLFSLMPIGNAQEICIADDMNPEQFLSAYNNTNIREKTDVRLIKKLSTDKLEDGSTANVYAINGNIPNILIAYTHPKRGLYQIDIIMKNANENCLKRFLLEVLMIERTIGTPDGDGTVNGMFAASDAIKFGKASYWDEHSARRFILQSIVNKEKLYMSFTANDT